MAKVKSINSSSSFYVNESSLPKLNFGLDTTNDCSKYDFDISSLLSDNETCLENGYASNDNWNEKKSDYKGGRCSPLTLFKKAESPNSSLDVLTENNLKETRMWPKLSLDGDVSLSDLLSDTCSYANSNNITPSESDNLLDLCLLTEDGYTNIEKTSGGKNDISFADLSDWMNSSVTQNSDSTELSHSHHLPCHDAESNVKKIFSASLKLNTRDFDSDIKLDCLDSIKGKSEYSNNISSFDFANILAEVSVDNSETTNTWDTTDSFETGSDEKHGSTNETSDNDFLPDIDLTFCIKKNGKTNISVYGNSPETVDSGFDESDFIPDKLFIPSQGKSFYEDILLSQDNNCSINKTNNKVNHSLFSKAISAKPKIDDSKKLKLKNVMNELLKGKMPTMPCIQQRNLKENEKVINHSNDNVITSSYLKFMDDE